MPIDVYCDGSETNAVMADPLTSYLGPEYVRRGIVVIPTLDLGLIAQTRQAERNLDRGCEALAIRLALELCASRGLSDFRVYNDNQGAVADARNPAVEWRRRKAMYLPNSFFEKVLGRAAYLRETAMNVKERRPIGPPQQEAFDLFNAPRKLFHLSESALWARVLADSRRHPDAMGIG